jgi:5-methylcytosine-specific restriction endonuclease McrA
MIRECAQEFLFPDDLELVAELHAISQSKDERLEYAAARKAAWYAGTPFPEDERKWYAFTNDYPRPKERERIQAEYREWYADHSEWRKHSTHARRARSLGRTVGRREPILRVYARARAAEVLYCHWCKRLTPSDDRAVDHIVPLARGGNHTAKNLCICCWSCNQAKGAQAPQDFLEAIKGTRKHNLSVRRRGLESQLRLEFDAEAPHRRKLPRRATQLTLVRLRA